MTTSGVRVDDSSGPQYVVLLSFDGFRYDYADKFAAANFKAIARDGVRAEAMIPGFPSMTFPAHYSLVTGLHPASHNLINNSFYNADRSKLYSLKDRSAVEDGTWYGGEPIWLTAEKQGLRTASFFWVGTEANIRGRHPSYYYRYDETVSNNARIDQLIHWLNLPEPERPRLLLAYFSLVDDAGHDFGPDSLQLKTAVTEADRLVGDLVKKLANTGLNINLVIVSDHGMIAVDTRRPIVPGDYTDLTNFDVVQDGPILMLYSDERSRVLRAYEDLRARSDHYDVYLRENIPAHWRLRGHPRVGDIFLIARAPYTLEMSHENVPAKGMHGYDPRQTPDMAAIFFARGPALKSGVIVPSFDNVHLYPLLASILQLKTPAVDGDIRELQHVLLAR